jgi:acyl-CoA thioester hydrolase
METTTEIRVRYAETDAMGIVHHAVYPVWMELGRSELLRQLGQSYSEWEVAGIRMTVNEIRVKYRAPARYDEIVRVHTRLLEGGRRRIVFAYRIERDGSLLAEAESVHLVCGSDGRARVLPDSYLALIRTGTLENG